MNKKINSVPSAGTKAEQSTNDETRLPSSPNNGNTHVVRSPFCVEPNDMANIQEIFVNGNILMIHFIRDKSFLQIPTDSLLTILNEKLKSLDGITVQISP